MHDCLYIGAGKPNLAAASSSAAPLTPQQIQQAALALSPPNGPKLTFEDQQKIQALSSAANIDPSTATQLLFQSQGNLELAMQQVQALRASGQTRL